MKALVLFQRDGLPQVVDNYPEPQPSNDQQIVINITAAAIKHLDKSQASGKHYSTENDLSKAKIPGGDGVGILENGDRVYALGSSMMAEKAVVDKNKIIKIPQLLDDATAAALPNAVAGSAMAMLFRGGLQKGDTVLINGATSFTGKIAIQLAKHYGAGTIIATGRNPESLKELEGLGANIVISTSQDDESFCGQLKEIHQQKNINIVVDYLWGHTAELILSSVKGDGNFSNPLKFVSVGSITGENIQLSSQILRSTDIQICGSGLGSWTKEEMKQLITKIIPEVFELAAAKKIIADTEIIHINEVEKLWNNNFPNGKRLVLTF